MVRLTFAAVICAGVAICFFGGTRAVDACQIVRPPKHGNFFDGWLRAPNETVFETRAQIEEYNPYVANTYDDSISSAWVMLSDNHLIGGVHHFAQVGWWKWRHPGQSDGTRSLFASWTVNNNGTIQEIWLPDNYGVGAWVKYEVKYFNDGLSFNTYVMDGLFWQIQSDFVPNQATITGEITDVGNQMPGGTQNHDSLLDAFYQTGPGVNHFFNYPVPASIYISPGYSQEFASSVVNITQIDIWDQKCFN
jgi:hypothetical protein